jgi:transcriptional regulator GlxA family with amidase domain
LSPTCVIELFAFPSVQLLDITGPLQVFASSNDLLRARGRTPRYQIRVVAPAGKGVTSSAGFAFVAAPLPAVDASLDTLIVGGGPGVRQTAADPGIVKWLQARAGNARRVVSICTGAFLLAACGVLDGRRATTHWSHCADLARRHPDIRVECEPIFVRDGKVWTSAGVTAGIDLALAQVEEDLGREVALAVARYLVVFLKRPGGQAQFSTALTLQAADDAFGNLHAWINEHLHSDLSLSVLAARTGMSIRSFSRRYMESTGLTPAHAVERLRVEAARRMLSDSKIPIKRIAQRCGFGSDETMRRSFLRLLQTSPQDYRARFSF